jgi:MoxR-like ATPase
MKFLKQRSEAPVISEEWTLATDVLSSLYVRTIYIHGPPGIGKTYAAYNIGRIAAGVYPITLTPEMPASELMGHFIPKGNELVWQYGPFAKAMRAGGRLVINEISHASSDVLAILYPVLESVETAQLMLPTGEIIRPAAGFNVTATDNAPPDGLPEALQDRFDCVVGLTRPHPAVFAALNPMLRKAAERSFSLDDERRVSMRKWMTISRLMDVMGLEKACCAVLGAPRGRQVYEAIMLDQGSAAAMAGAAE